MKRIYLMVATIISIFQMNTSFAGKDSVLSKSLSYENYTTNSRHCYKSDSYESKILQGFYDDFLNYATVYEDGTYSVYFFKTNVDATYYFNGVIQCHYCDNRVAVYNPNNCVSEYFRDGDCYATHPGLPEGIPLFYPTPRCSVLGNILYVNENLGDQDEKKSKNKNVKTKNNVNINFKNKENNINCSIKNKNVLFYLSMIENKDKETNKEKDKFIRHIEEKAVKNSVEQSMQLSEQKNLDEDCLVAKEASPCESKNWAIVAQQSLKDLTPSLLNNNSVFTKVKKINYENLDGDAKLFLKNIEVRTLESLKQKIKKLRNNNGLYNKKNEFLDFIRAANDFRHSKNTENQLLAKHILKMILLNKNIDIFSKKLAYTYLGKIKSHQNQHEKAINKFQDGLNVCGDNARLYYFMGNNCASLEKYDEAIQNWEKALVHIEKNDLEIKIKAHTRLLYCKEYHQKDAKTIHELYFQIIELIQNNNVIADYKDLYRKLIMDFADYKTTNNCAAMFVFEKPRTNGSISKNMLDKIGAMYEKHKSDAVEYDDLN